MNAQTMLPAAVSASPFEDLFETLTSVHSLFDSTLGSLDHTSREMRGRGLPPGHSLVFEIGECHRAFIRLRAELMRRAEMLGLDVPPLERVADLQDLANLLSHYQNQTSRPITHSPEHEPTPAVQQAEPITAPADLLHEIESHPIDVEPKFATPEVFTNSVETIEARPSEPSLIEPIHEPPPTELPSDEFSQPLTTEADPADLIRSSALSVLEHVLALRLSDSGEFAPLTACQTHARHLRDAIVNADLHQLPIEAHQIAGGEHPFSSLLIVVSGEGDMEDDHWANHHSQISETFGRPMAVAAARGRLSIPD